MPAQNIEFAQQRNRDWLRVDGTSCGTVQQALAAIFVSSHNDPPPLLGKSVTSRDKTQHGSNTFQPLFH